GDGKVVMLGLQNEREWQTFCTKVLENPELAADPRFDSNARRTASRAALRAIIVDAFARFTAEQVVALLDEAGIADARMNTMDEVWAHPQLKARNRWAEVGTPAGPVPTLLPPGMSREDDPRIDPVPALGAHTDAILFELGYAQPQIDRLRNEGAL